MTDRRTFPHGSLSPMPVRRRLLLLLLTVALLPTGVAAATAAPLRADSGEFSARGLGGGVTIVPGRSGLVEISGYDGADLPAGSSLRLTAPAGARITGTPLADTARFQGEVTADGTSGTYTYVRDSGPGSWKDGGYPFALAVDARAVPGTRLPGCAVVLTDAGGARRASGRCTVTVGMPVPTLTEPAGGTFVSGAARLAGTSYPGARVSVLDAAERTVCAGARASTAPGRARRTPRSRRAPTGCTPAAAFHGVSAVGEDVDFTVTARTP